MVLGAINLCEFVVGKDIPLLLLVDHGDPLSILPLGLVDKPLALKGRNIEKLVVRATYASKILQPTRKFSSMHPLGNEGDHGSHVDFSLHGPIPCAQTSAYEGCYTIVAEMRPWFVGQP